MDLRLGYLVAIFLIVLILIGLTLNYLGSLTSPTVDEVSCDNTRKIAKNYTLSGEKLILFGEYKASSAHGLIKSRYCLFKITNPKIDGRFIPINAQSRERVKENDTIRSLALAFYTSKWVSKEQKNLSPALEEAHKNVKAAEYGQNAQKRMGELALDGADHITVKYSNFNLDGGKIANLAKELTCQNAYSCTDWDKFKTQMSTLRTRTIDFATPDVLYEDDLITYLAGLENTQRVLESVDQEYTLHLSSPLEPYDFSSHARHIRNNANNEPQRVTDRVSYIENSLKQKKQDIQKNLTDINNSLHSARKKGKPVGDLHEKYCTARNTLPDNNLLVNEKFSTYREQLEEVENSPIYSTRPSDYPEMPSGFLNRILVPLGGRLDALIWSCGLLG